MNDEMKMKGGSGTKCKPQYSERMLNVFNLHLSAPDGKAMSRICASKPWRNLQYLAGAYNSNSHTRRLLLSYFCMRKQAGKSLQWRESFKEVCLRKAQHYQSSLNEEKPLQFLIPLTLSPKNHNLFCECEEGLKRGGEKKENPCPLVHNAKV
jgi:hypothetical protein